MQPREIPFTPTVTADAATGRNVTRISPPGTLSTHAYFTSPSHDGPGNLIVSMDVDGKVQLCRIDLSAQAAWQVTDLPAVRPQSYCVDPARNQALLIQDRALLSVDLDSGEVREVFIAPGGYRLATPTVDASGRYAALCVMEDLPIFHNSDHIYARMPEQFYARLRCLIVRVDLDSGEARVVWGEMRWLSHVLICPHDPDTIVFCHEGGELVDHRLWAVSAKPQHKKKPRCLFRETANHFLVHEFFCDDGVLGVQCSVMHDSHEQLTFEDPRGKHSVLFLDMSGQVVCEYGHPARPSMHVQASADRSMIVADTFSDSWDEPADRDHLSLLRPDERGMLSAERLCFHGTSWASQHSHPHPRFGPGGSEVVFTSDAGGTPSAYVVDL
jgi:oligogalacturonide lyase